MSVTCPKCRTVIETVDTAFTLAEQLAATKQKLEAAEELLELYKVDYAKEIQRAEAAESRINASQEQEPYAYVRYGLFGIPEFYTAPYQYTSDFALFKQPIIPPEKAELLQRIAELEKQVKEGK